MSEVNFKSTFRIPVSQHGISRADKARLKNLINNYENSIVGTGTTGYARVSITNDLDASFVDKLKSIGFKIYQKFSGENIPRKNIDDYIKSCMEKQDYKEFGKRKAKKITKNSLREQNNLKIQNISEKSSDVSNSKEKDYFINNVSKDNQILIKESADYKRIAKKYGTEFADAMFFFTKKK